MTQLIVMLGKKTERTVLLDTPKLTIGRAADSNLVLESEVISRVHAQVVWNGQQHVIEDLLSTSGVYVNGERTTRHALAVGDQIALGKFTLVYQAGSAEEAVPASSLGGKTDAAPDAAPAGGGGDATSTGSALFWQQGLAEQSSPGPSMTTGSHAPEPRDEAAVSASHLQATRGPDTDDDFKGTMMVTGDELQKVRATLLTSQGPHLRVRVEGDFQRLPVGEDPIVVGYHGAATFRLPGSKWLGKEQFRVSFSDDVTYLTTLSFWARVVVDGRRVRGRVVIQPGATIQAGGLKFQYLDGDE